MRHGDDSGAEFRVGLAGGVLRHAFSNFAVDAARMEFGKKGMQDVLDGLIMLASLSHSASNRKSDRATNGLSRLFGNSHLNGNRLRELVKADL